MTRTPVSGPRGVLRRPTPTPTPQPQSGPHYARLGPIAPLAPHLAHFWSVRWDLAGQPPFVAETLPHPSVHLLFEARRADVAGIMTGKFSRTLRGRGWVFGIKFRPAAFQPLYGAPLARLTNRVVPLRAIFGAAGATLARALRAEPTVEGRAQLAEAFLLPRLAPLPPVVAELRDLVERMAADATLVRVEDVAALAGVGVRALERSFRTYVGVTPKWVIGRYRLHEAAAQLAAARAPNLAELAQRLGYFDQAHFIRDFKAVVGRSPGRYAKE